VSTEEPRPPVLLADLDEDARQAAFDVLQAGLPDLWRGMRRDLPDESVVVVPSSSVDRVVALSPARAQALEERLLFMLLLLRQPHLRLVYVTSTPVDPRIVEYYLALLPGVIPSHARNRLSLVSVGDAGPEPLTAKLLARPRLLADIVALVPDRSRSHLVPYTTTAMERDLALSLGIGMYASDPRLFPLGTKTGCRRLFGRAGVPYPAGTEAVRTVDDVVAALVALRRREHGPSSAMVKLDEGVAGRGNAVVDLTGLPPAGDPAEPGALTERVHGMALDDPDVSMAAYLAKLAERGGVVEERVVGEEVRSPSVQLRITPLGEVELLSTHDQVLGGATGQSYEGATFPADPAYARLISEQAAAVARVLVQEGVIGRFAIDFVVVRRGDGWDAYAIELNLRKGGTTHPFLTLQFLTDGAYDAETARFSTPGGQSRHLVATDHLHDDALRGLRVGDLFDVVARRGLHFDRTSQSGVVLHMMSSITETGTIGMTAVGGTAEEAMATYTRAGEVLLEEAREAVRARPLPPPPTWPGR
jgi:hypothetical protein